MSEITIPLEDLVGQPTPNGHVGESQTDQPEAKGPRVDPARGVFITASGDEIEFSDKRVSRLMLDRVRNQGKPDIPKIEVVLMGKHHQLEDNPNDQNYLVAHKAWIEAAIIRMLKYLILVKVKGQPTQEFIDENREFFPDADEKEMKYLYFANMLTEEDIAPFLEAATGHTAPTTEGIEESAKSFRSNG